MIVILSIAGIVMEKMKSGHILPINPTLIRVMRVLRIARGNCQISPHRHTSLSLSLSSSSETIENGQRYSSSPRHRHSGSSSSWQLGNCSPSLALSLLPDEVLQGLLFFLLFFIFAALGVELFGKLECSEELPCTGLDKHAHFKDFGMAFLTLFRIATGDNWNGIMKVGVLRERRTKARRLLCSGCSATG